MESNNINNQVLAHEPQERAIGPAIGDIPSSRNDAINLTSASGERTKAGVVVVDPFSHSTLTSTTRRVSSFRSLSENEDSTSDTAYTVGISASLSAHGNSPPAGAFMSVPDTATKPGSKDNCTSAKTPSTATTRATSTASFSSNSRPESAGSTRDCASSATAKPSCGLDPFVAFLFPSFHAGSSLDDRAPTQVLWSASQSGKKRSASESGLDEEDISAVSNKKICVEPKAVDGTKEQFVSELVDETELSLFKRNKKSQPQGKICPFKSNKILRTLPREVLDHCLSFLDPVRDRANTARSCKTFNTIMLSPHIMRNTDLFGVPVQEEGQMDEEADDDDIDMISFVNEDEDTKGLLHRLEPYLEAENYKAMYIAGMILIYCHDEVAAGVGWLEAAAKYDHDEALYALGIITRDAQRERSIGLMGRAHAMGFFPATMEVMNARELRDVHGEPSADALRAHLGPKSLHRLMRKYFVDTSKFRSHSSSHCWNPMCGRWAYKYPREHVVTMQNNMAFLEQNTLAKNGTTSNPQCSLKCARMKMCSSCRRAKYCSKICQVYDWRSGRHKLECQFIG